MPSLSRVDMESLLCMCLCSLGFSNGLGIRRPVFTFTSSDYAKILKTASFVDKTLMIENVIDEPGVVLITAPPRFGKSTNLDMVKRFFEIEVDEEGGLRTAANLTTDEPVRDTPNYKLFAGSKLKIAANLAAMDGHFGKTPVIRADFRCANVVRTYDEAVDFCREVIHNTYKDHAYLRRSEGLTPHQKSLFERWSDESAYRNLSRQHVTHGLRVLTVYVSRHFGRRSLVLIDEHDSIVSKAMFDVAGAEVLRKIISLSVSVMSTALRNNDLYVRGGLVTGVSDIPMFGFSDLNNVKTCRFLEEHAYLDYYGLTQPEAERLLRAPEFKIDPKLAKEAKAAYNGYQSEGGKKIYNTYSLMRFLKMGSIRNYWTKFGKIRKLRNVFSIPAFQPYVAKLVAGNSISIVMQEKLTVEEVIDLRNLLKKPQKQINYWPATLFNYLFKQGYLTFMPSQQKSPGVSVKKVTVKIPNAEIREYISRFS